MGKSSIFCLSILLSKIVMAQSNLDSLINIESYEKNAYNYFVDCLDRNNCNNQFSKGFLSCADSTLMKYPKFSYAERIKCNQYIKTGNLMKFFEHAEKAIAIDVKEYEKIAYFAFYEAKDYPKALDWFRKYDALTPTKGDIVMNDNILSLYGLCFSQMEELDSALYYFNYLIDTGHDGNYKFFPTLYDYTNRGVIHLKKGNLDLAKKDFEKTIKEYSQSVEGHFFLAKTLYLQGEEPYKIEPLLNLALKYYDAGLKNNHPYGEYVDLPNEIWRSDIMGLYYKVKGARF